ncbi:MAG: hypothetical protein D3907_01570 [Candidatus Electrothrix sp. AUS3]|nr:hypothetical protein [Candidatus Electrothrix gigas]
MLQGFKKPNFALLTNILRQILLPLLLFPLFSKSLGIMGLWICILVIVWGAAIVSLFYGRFYLLKFR